MLTTEQINDLHRLYWSEHWPIRKIERHLNMGWKTIRKYLDAPAQGPVHRDRPSKLDPFKGADRRMAGEGSRASPPPSSSRSSASAGISGRPQHSAGVCAQSAPAADSQARLRPHGTARRRTIRGRLGPLRRARLLGRYAQTVCLRAGRCAQPDAVCRVHSQPELRNLRPLPHSRLHRSWRGGARNRLRQSGHRRCRT